jgi:hypothetical protein
VPNQSNENAEDAETPRTLRLGESLGSLLKFLRSPEGAEDAQRVEWF